LWRLIADAYDTFPDGRVDPLRPLVPLPPEGGPDWARSVRYTIDAKAEGLASGAMMRGLLMQALLEERFHLRAHRETREVPAYLMTICKEGSKLRPTEEGSCVHLDPTDLAQRLGAKPTGKPWCFASRHEKRGSLIVYDAHGMTLDYFASVLHPDHRDGRPVINRTGLTGLFDIHFEWEEEAPDAAAADRGAAPEPGGGSFLGVIRKQLGLCLEPGKGPREFLMIDHVERPSEN